jgi:NAD(P)-dependent dehydrogenase (short-subunit alcohol dehydrogenase family)
MDLDRAFDFTGKIAAITGGGGVLCGTMARALAQRGASVAVLDICLPAAQKLASEIESAGGRAIALEVNVLDKESLETAAQRIVETFGRVDILINGAGGAKKEATTSESLSFFELPEDAVRWVFDLNFMGTFLACQVFGRHMVEQGSGSILNIASMGGYRPLTRSVAYSAAKAAVINFTQWLAVHFSQEYSARIRVNALAPGFFLTEQNRFLLVDEWHGELTERGRRIVAHTPVGHFGQPEDLIGPALMLLSDVAPFVHGTVLMVDGGFNAYGGV